MGFPKFHGITLAANSVIENLHVERLAADPVPVAAGRLWFNTTAKQLKFSSLDAGGAIVVKIVASDSDMQAALAAIAALDTRITAVEGSYINKDGSVAFTGDQSMGGNKLTNVAAPVADTDAANRKFVVDAIAVLGNAFEYVGAVEGGAAAGTPFDLGTLTKKEAGDYYKVTTAGFFKLGAEAAFYANIGDGLVFNTTGSIDKIDNTDSNVQGTANFVTVTGSADTGFTVDIAPEFKGRVDALESGLAAEAARAQAAEGALDTRMTAAEGAITALQGAGAQTAADLAAEVTRAQNAESTLAGQISTEASRAQGAETTLQGNIDTVAADLAAEVTRATGAESTLTTNLAAEVTRATAAEAGLQTAIDTVGSDLAAEVTRATGIEAGLRTDLTAETTRATGVEAGLRTDLNAEIARAQAAEGAIDTKVGDLASLTTQDKTSIVAAINNLQVLAGGGTDALKAAINAQKFTYQSGAPALVHVVQHNLNTAFPGVDIRVKGDDGVYRNDIVAFEETNANTITVSMTEARDIKVSVQNMDNLA